MIGLCAPSEHMIGLCACSRHLNMKSFSKMGYNCRRIYMGRYYIFEKYRFEKNLKLLFVIAVNMSKFGKV